jgi:lipopolysaccharide/colanic/teichoic acid biosynthesis glycosyltransferase
LPSETASRKAASAKSTVLQEPATHVEPRKQAPHSANLAGLKAPRVTRLRKPRHGQTAARTSDDSISGSKPTAPAGQTPPSVAPNSLHARLTRPLLDALLLCLCLPPAVLIGSAVALVNWCIFKDAGLILFSQPRIGQGGRVFQILKFRTMHSVKAGAFASWSQSKDQLRVTRFGRFLRNSHLDELPQLINILRGEMSFIGPRPEMVEIEAWASEAIPDFGARLAVKPGITGLAQVAQGYVGNDIEGYQRKFDLSMEYLERYSLALDLSILTRTALTMLRLRGWRWDPTPRPDAPSGGPRIATPNRLWE